MSNDELRYTRWTGSVWTTDATQELIALFIESPDESKQSFIEKLRGQLETVCQRFVIHIGHQRFERHKSLLPGKNGHVHKRVGHPL